VKAGAGEPVAIVEGGTAQVIGALRIDEKLHAVARDDFVAGLAGAERHFVLEPGAAALGDPDPKALAFIRGARFEQGAQLADCVFRHGDHRLGKIIVFLRNRKSPP
jgi:hypothetical protein